MISTQQAHLHVAAVSHPGKKRRNNEDRYAVTAHRLDAQSGAPSVLAVLCDGVGGHRAGEVAAEIAVETISHIVSQSDASQPLDILAQGMSQASQAISEQAAKDSEKSGMGATCVCAWVIGERLYIAWEGDSRLYLVRNGQIQQLTTDHTWVQEAMEHGVLTPEQARNHPNAHVIHRYLGSKQPSPPDLRLRLNPEESDEQALANQGMRLLPGDKLLLCSDGLTDLVEDEEILNTLQTQSRKTAIDVLLHMALDRGGLDNTTIITMEVPTAKLTSDEGKLPGQQTLLGMPRTRAALTCALLGGLALLMLVLGSLAAWYFTRPDVTPTTTPIHTTLAIPTRTSSLPFEETPAPTKVQEPLVTSVEKASVTPGGSTPTPWPTHTQFSPKHTDQSTTPPALTAPEAPP
ncbi:MAG: serine/threonine-protein phosphatase [Anaerolineales bacterium]|nr:serine/threonine-protein phosphatase [Anaerolineales bacterium]